MSSEQFDLSRISDANVLVNSFNQCKKGTTWKTSVQKYEINLLTETLKTKKKLETETYKASPFVEFSLSERGKTRWIKSMHIKDRVVQRALCDNVLLPELTKYLIYDNGASLKDKGIDFALNRVYKQLNDYFVKNKTNKGYVVLVDFSKYFDNIPHDKMIEAFTRDIKDEKLINLIEYLVSLFEIDLSVLPDEMQEEFKNGVFNNVKYSAYLHKNHLKPNYKSNNKMKKSAGVGSQISQIIGVYYPTYIDNYFKIVKGVKGYERYMDDTVMLARTLDEAKGYLDDMYRLCEEGGIHINKKKTQIIKLESGFTFLKVKHRLTETGKIIRTTSHKNTTRERRKIKTLTKRAIEKNDDSFNVVKQSYNSYKGRLIRFNDHRTMQSMDKLFVGLYLDYLLSESKNE